MPIADNTSPKPHWLIRNGHIHSIWTYYTRRAGKPAWLRTRIETPDDDFLDLDFIKKGHNRVVLILHGIDGNTDRHYIRGFARHASESGYDVCAQNSRGCSGELNRKYASYHSAQTYDIHHVCKHLIEECHYSEIYIVGFSLGGNVVFKYLGEDTDRLPSEIVAAAGVSVPIDLKAGCEKLSRGIYLGYSIYLLSGLKPRTRAKMKKHSRDPEELRKLRRIVNFRQFDELYTVPAHGFQDAEDYWHQAASHAYLKKLKTPTLLITALDDPFLSEESFPFDLAANSEYLHFCAPLRGGHVGFAYGLLTPKTLWCDEKILGFFGEVRGGW